MLKRLVGAVVFLVSAATGLLAQETQGYLFMGFGQTHFEKKAINSGGGGVEHFGKYGVGMGLEAGFFAGGAVPSGRPGCHVVSYVTAYPIPGAPSAVELYQMSAVVDRSHIGCGSSAFASPSLLYSFKVSERWNPFAAVGGVGTVEMACRGEELPVCSAAGNSGLSFGGGVNYWYAPKAASALRLEYRGFHLKHCGGCNSHTIRIGLTFGGRR